MWAFTCKCESALPNSLRGELGGRGLIPYSNKFGKQWVTYTSFMKLLKAFTLLTWVTFLEEDSKQNPQTHASESLLQNSGHTLYWEVILIPTCSRVEGVSWKSLKEIQILRLQCNALKFHCHLRPKPAFTQTTQLLTLLSRWSCFNLSKHPHMTSPNSGLLAEIVS